MAQPQDQEATAMEALVVQEIALRDLDSDPHNPRQIFDEAEINALARSIQNIGFVHPIVVRPGRHGRYLIVVGERRYRAARRLGLATLPAVVRPYDDHQAYLEIQLAENLPGYRVDWTVWERARALRAFVATFPTHQACAEHLGRTGAWLSQMLDILELPPAIRSLNDQGIVRDRITLIGLRRLEARDPLAAQRLIAQARHDRRLRRQDVLDLLVEPVRPAAQNTAEVVLREPIKVRVPEKYRRVAHLLGMEESVHPEVLLEKLMDAYLQLLEGDTDQASGRSFLR